MFDEKGRKIINAKKHDDGTFTFTLDSYIWGEEQAKMYRLIDRHYSENVDNAVFTATRASDLMATLFPMSKILKIKAAIDAGDVPVLIDLLGL